MGPPITADVSFGTPAIEKGETRWGLYGQHYFRAKLGVTATVGYNVDSFGHSAMLPQILHKSGLNSYVFLRPQPHEMGLPSRRCWWESDDGSRVLACRIAYEYCTWGLEVHQQVRQCMAELRAPLDEVLCFYGVGNHGGGPTRENLQSIRELDKDPALPGLSLSTPTRRFQSARHKDVPLHGEGRGHGHDPVAAVEPCDRGALRALRDQDVPGGIGMAGSNSLCSSGDTAVTETNLLEWTEEVGR